MRTDHWLAWRVHELLRMNDQELCGFPVNADQTSRPAGATERPIKISIVFDDDASAQSAEGLVRHMASDYECDRQSFSFDELDFLLPGVAAAHSACNSEVFVLAVRDDRPLPSHVKSWLGLCIGLRDEDQDDALVLLVAEMAQTSKAGSSLLGYLDTVAVIGRIEFFSRQRDICERVNPAHKHLEMEDTVCGSSD